MKFVVDANILFALANSESAANSLVSDFMLELFSPDFSLVEIKKYKKDISEKSGVEFDGVLELLKEKVKFIDESQYSGMIKKLSSKLTDKKDVPYFALACKLNLPLWSNDKHLKEQSLIPVFTTRELVEILSSL